MTTRKSSTNFSSLLAILYLLLSAVTVSAQVLTPERSKELNPAQQPNPAVTATPTPAETPTVYGVQGVLIETLDRKVVASQAVEQPLNPASAVKLATALVALKTFGPQHRFMTGFWTDGSFDKATGTINGNLYVSGRDPSFHYEHAVLIARQLNGLGIRTVTGNLIIAPGFTMNFNWSARSSGERLYDTLDSTLRSAAATNAWNYSRLLVGENVSTQPNPSVAVMGEVMVNAVAPRAKLLLTHSSSKLTDVLKVLLCYSNNFMAERLGDSLGGVDSVQRAMVTGLGIPAYEFRLASLSGLGSNRVSARAMMTVFRALREELRKHKLSTTDIMPVAAIDPGTMEDRFTDFASRGSVIAKTGTLVRTDGGVSALVGQMKTATGEILLFVILNQRGNVSRFRDNQDYLIKQVQSTRGGPKAFDYKPITLAMRLSDTQSTVASEDEYEQ